MAGKAADKRKRPPARKPARSRGRKRHEVKLGRVAENGISASLLGLIERGANKRPTLAKELRGRIEIRFKEDFAPVRAVFDSEGILVEDGIDDAQGEEPFRPDLVISGSLPQIVQLTSAPLFGGLPRPTHARGRAALAKVAARKVKIEGNPLLARRVLKLLEI